MKFLIIASYPDSLVKFRGPLILKLVELGLEVHVAAPKLKACGAFVEKLRELGAECHDAPIDRTGLNPFRDLTSLYELTKLIKQIGPDYVFSYTIKPVIWGGIAAAFLSVPKRFALISGLGYAFTSDAKGLRRFVKRIAQSLYKYSLKKSTLIFFQNKDDLQEFKSIGLISDDSRTMIVNGSGVNISEYSVQSFSFPRKERSLKFLLVGRILGDKGVREYVAAAKIIKEKYENAEFHLVGGLDSNPEAIEEAEISSWTKSATVMWHGAVDDVRPFIADSHVYVLPSYREGTPRSVLEAMSMGRPIITTDAPGCRETVVDGDNGFLVDVKSVEQLVEAMEQFIKQPELIESMGKRSREIACKKYDVHKVNGVMLRAMEIIKE
ncbi:glycosyltransferase family 4 protein [Idiomarina sp.]|uniref:glycosyltransferase family 4 protein n=1 Tax=Idiomarina sp. TaxID=1874361 RepID=UPI0025C5529D|nr:glycosyltransferase family 4 protein [Idiomarina sp.]NQZ04708.1 glycosyltransferase family 4 protein [Idiomarina sp.]